MKQNAAVRACRSRSDCSRRAFLGAVALLAVRGQASAAPEPTEKRRIVVVGGHPGDPEYGCGGTVARYADIGHEVTLLYLNRGQSANNGPPACVETDPSQGSTVRVQEAANAARILGARTEFADQCNSHAVVDLAHYEQFAQLVTALNPDVIFNQWPIDNHPDHRAISNLTVEAWVRMDRRPALYYYEVSDGEDTEMFSPTDYVDVSAVEPRKREACYAHASQAPDRYYSLQSKITEYRGIQSGYSQAEAFIRHVRSRHAELP